MIDVEELVSEAKEELKKRYGRKILDDTVYCGIDVMEVLIEAGAKSIKRNQYIWGHYLNMVSYDGVTFRNISKSLFFKEKNTLLKTSF